MYYSQPQHLVVGLSGVLFVNVAVLFEEERGQVNLIDLRDIVEAQVEFGRFGEQPRVCQPI
jgi:hypothetical protein